MPWLTAWAPRTTPTPDPGVPLPLGPGHGVPGPGRHHQGGALCSGCLHVPPPGAPGHGGSL
eukprot:870933-Rhodomonas_salina.1